MSKKGGFGKFLGGIALGAGLGILFAPKSGEETRKDLKLKIEKDRALAVLKETLTKKYHGREQECFSHDILEWIRDSYLENLGAETLFPAKALGPGSEREKYILAAFVVPKSRLEPLC